MNTHRAGSDQRRILLLAHTGREESCAIAREIGTSLGSRALRLLTATPQLRAASSQSCSVAMAPS